MKCGSMTRSVWTTSKASAGKPPCIAAVRPSGPYTVGDFDEAGGIRMVMKRLEDRLDREVLTVTGTTLAENLSAVRVKDSPVIRNVSDPVSHSGLAVLRGSLARSAVVRPTVVVPEMMHHQGPARVYNGQEEALEALAAGQVKPGDVVVVRFEGPRGGPGLTEVFKVIGYMRALGLESRCALVTDGKISGFAKGPVYLPGLTRSRGRRSPGRGSGWRPDRNGHPQSQTEPAPAGG